MITHPHAFTVTGVHALGAIASAYRKSKHRIQPTTIFDNKKAAIRNPSPSGVTPRVHALDVRTNCLLFFVNKIRQTLLNVRSG